MLQTPDRKKKPVMAPNGEIAYLLSPIDTNSSPSPGNKRRANATHGTPISTVNHQDNDVKRSRKAQQNGPSPPSPPGVGIMPGAAAAMTPNAGI
jgi:hypothetical protein